MLMLEVKGITTEGLIFDNEHWRCSKCGAICKVGVNLDQSKRWYLEQMVEFEVTNEAVTCVCPECGHKEQVILQRGTMFGVLV